MTDTAATDTATPTPTRDYNADPKDIIKYLNSIQNFNDGSIQFTTSMSVLKAATVYKYLYKFHFNLNKPLADILHENDYNIGLNSLSNSNTTRFFDKMLGRYQFFHTHLILHNAYGRFYKQYNIDRGYCYVLPKTTKYMKKCKLFGHMSGLMFTLRYPIIHDKKPESFNDSISFFSRKTV